MIIVDRIEEDFAVVYFGDIRRDIPLTDLPEGVHESCGKRPWVTSLTKPPNANAGQKSPTR